MAEGEEIEIRLDGVKLKSIDDLPPELRAEVNRRIEDGRKSYTAKYAPGKLRLHINVRQKTSKAALKSGTKPPTPMAIEDGGVNWIVIIMVIAALGAAVVSIPGASDVIAKLKIWR
jgi:hypothetical protein